jgi:DNA-binding NarL/FixJ family response regulator
MLGQGISREARAKKIMKAAARQRKAGKRAKILIVDDHPITRHGLAQLLNHEADLLVCGEAEDAQRALSLIKSLEPDLVLSDITMTGKSGLELIKEMQVLHPQVAVLVLSMHDESIYAERMLRAGARGYLMKSAGGAELLVAIRQVLRGEVYLSKKMSAEMINLLSGSRSKKNRSALEMLTDREFEVFQLLGHGLSTREIGQRLHISSKTVDTHRLNIKDKLNLGTLPELMRYAVRWGATEALI